MNKKILKIKNDGFLSAVVTLMSGSIIAQLITIVSAILLARLYSPEELGVYTLILTAESLFGSVICLRYDISIVSEKKEEKVYSLIKLAIILSIVLALIITIGYWRVYFWGSTEYAKYSSAAIFICVMLCARGVINVLESYNNRHKEYSLMTSTYILRTIVQNVGAIILGFFNFGVLGIVFSHTVGLLCGMKRQSKKLIEKKTEILSISNSELCNTAKENYKQPLFSAPAVFANRYSYSSISLFIGQLFGANILGFYSISYKALGLPLTVLSNNVSKIFYKEATKEYQEKGEFKKPFFRTSIILITISIPFGICVYFFSPYVFKIVLGEEWIVSALYVQILIPMFCIRLVVNTVAYGLQIVGKQNLELLYQMLLVFVSIFTFFIVKLKGLPIEVYLQAITIGFSIIYILYFCTVLKYSLGGKQKM